MAINSIRGIPQTYRIETALGAPVFKDSHPKNQSSANPYCNIYGGFQSTIVFLGLG